MDRLSGRLRRHVAALRAVLVLTVILGGLYPLAVTGVAQALLNDKANGQLIERDGRTVGSAVVGQPFTDQDGAPIVTYFQSRPSAAGDGYDLLATAASNLGPEDIVDTLATPQDPGSLSLLTQVCRRSAAVGKLEGVSGARPYCTVDGVGAVLKVFPGRAVSVNQACPAVPFVATYKGVKVECATPGEDYAAGASVAVRGDGVAVVPADAVTASASGLDPHISVAYAELQAPRIARERGIPLERVQRLIGDETTGRALGFMGEPAVNVLALNLALDR